MQEYLAISQMAETGREEFPQGLKARFCVSLNVGAKAPTPEMYL
jgi:hypothetical protein